MENLVMELLSKEKPVVIGHRGAAGLAIENTISAIKKALSLGIKIVEVDVRITSDKKLVVFHDEDLSRLAGVNKKIRDSSLEELRKISINNERIPTLDEVLSEIAGRAGILIEVKDKDIEELVLASVKENKAYDWSAIISFHEEVVKNVKLLCDKLPTGLVYFLPRGKINKAKELGASIVLPYYKVLTQKHLDSAHKQKLKTIVWTVNDVSKAIELASIGVDGITTDYPNLVLEALNTRDKLHRHE